MFLPRILSNLAEFRVAVSRIQELLEAEEVEGTYAVDKSAPFAVQVKNGSFIWDTAPEMPAAQKKDTAPSAADEEVESLTEEKPEVIHLQNINFAIPKGKYT